jgi:hypothetical protein
VTSPTYPAPMTPTLKLSVNITSYLYPGPSQGPPSDQKITLIVRPQRQDVRGRCKPGHAVTVNDTEVHSASSLIGGGTVCAPQECTVAPFGYPARNGPAVAGEQRGPGLTQATPKGPVV